MRIIAFTLIAFVLSTSSSSAQFGGDVIIIAIGPANTNIGEIGNNYWGTNVDPGTGASCGSCKWNSSILAEVDAEQIQYTSAGKLGGPFNPDTVYWHTACGDGTGDRAGKPKGIKTLSVDTAYDSCKHMFDEATQDESPSILNMHAAYDTLKRFIVSCPFNENAPRAFGMISEAAGGTLPRDTLAYLGFRQWLESVLYLNTTNPEYFCACVEQIAGTFYTNADTGRNYLSAPNTALSVYHWLILNTTCDTPSLWKIYRDTRYNQYQNWLNDTTYPLDTTLPTMAQLGLDTLLARHFLYSVAEQPASILSNANASPNPVSEGTVISFGISKAAYVKIEVFNLLGVQVASSGFESLFEPGNHAVPISLAGLPSGTYYARILTTYGEVATVKLVKE